VFALDGCYENEEKLGLTESISGLLIALMVVENMIFNVSGVKDLIRFTNSK
jgi:hypothetical protein